MNLSKSETLEDVINRGYPVYVTYKEDNKEIVEWWAFGENSAKAVQKFVITSTVLKLIIMLVGKNML